MDQNSQTPTGRGIPGTLAGAALARDAKGRPYLKGRFSWTDKSGKARTITAMAFGANVARLGASFTDGATTLSGAFEGGVLMVLRSAADACPPGFFRSQPCGPNGSARRLAWVAKAPRPAPQPEPAANDDLAVRLHAWRS